MFIQTETRTYRVQGRNGYYAVDEYKGDSMPQCIISGVTNKVAQRVANACAGAVHNHKRDMSRTTYPGDAVVLTADTDALEWDTLYAGEATAAVIKVKRGDKYAFVDVSLACRKPGQFKVIVNLHDAKDDNRKAAGTLYLNTRGITEVSND